MDETIHFTGTIDSNLSGFMKHGAETWMKPSISQELLNPNLSGFCCGEEEIPVHQFVLEVMSPVLRTMFANPDNQECQTLADRYNMEELLDFCSTTAWANASKLKEAENAGTVFEILSANLRKRKAPTTTANPAKKKKT